MEVGILRELGDDAKAYVEEEEEEVKVVVVERRRGGGELCHVDCTATARRVIREKFRELMNENNTRSFSVQYP